MLFEYFYNQACQELLVSVTSIECMAKYSTDADCLKKLLECYERSPSSFSIPKVYHLVQMILGFGYNGEIDEDFVQKLISRAKQDDQTNGFQAALDQFQILRMSRPERLELLKTYMLNPGQKFSVGDLERFCSVFNSRYLPQEVLDEYLPLYFDLAHDAFKINLNMYSRVSRMLTTEADGLDSQEINELVCEGEASGDF
jgi:hypothetical protein